MSPPKLNPVEPPWYGPVCPVVGEGWHREVSPYPDQLDFSYTFDKIRGESQPVGQLLMSKDVDRSPRLQRLR